MPMNDKALIRGAIGLMTMGLVGTLAVLAHLLPTPAFSPPNPVASPFYNAFVAKDQLLTAYQWVRLHVFHAPPPSVVIGQQGWLYYRSEAVGNGDTFNDFTGRALPDGVTLEHWRQTLVKRRSLLEARGTRFLATVPPNTVTIYPEYLPDEIRRQHGRTRLDALLEAAPGEVLDLRPALTKRKAIEPVYDSSDTHWNDAGAFAAYEAITAELMSWFPNIKPLQRSELSTRQALRNREIDFLIGLDMVEKPLPSTFIVTKKAFGARCQDTGEPVLAPNSIRDDTQAVNATIRNWVWLNGICPSGRFVQDRPELPKALVFHDSFMILLHPFLSQNFREVRYVLSPYNQTIVDQESPEVVIQAFTERYLASRMF